MIILFTDFGIGSPYVAQMKAVLYRDAAHIPVINLFADAPTCNPRAAAYLLAAYIDEFPLDSIFLCVIDPGVGSERRPIIMRANGRWFVGPDNGLFNVVANRSQSVKIWEITWKPTHLSASFHGRDLFAPVAARLAQNHAPSGELLENKICIEDDWPQDLAECIYIDHFGNVITGLRSSNLPANTRIEVNKQILAKRTTFSDVPEGTAFWYENANGLVEIAVNQGQAASILDIKPGNRIVIIAD